MKNIQVLIATMRCEDFNLHKKMNVTRNALVINQTGIINDDDDKVLVLDQNTKYISTNQIGLSKSRNKALHNATADICVISDDDMIYKDNFEEIVIDAYEKNLDADIIVFKVTRINGREKKFSNSFKRINFFSSLKISSVEITFKRNSILDKGIKFNELLGAGANYYMGEENNFLISCLKNGLKIYYVPIEIATVDMSESTWFKEYDREYFFARGGSYAAMFPIVFPIIAFQFIIRKKKTLKLSNKKIIKAYYYSLVGAISYKKESSKIKS